MRYLFIVIITFCTGLATSFAQTYSIADGTWSTNGNWDNNSPSNSTNQDSWLSHAMETNGNLVVNDTIVIESTGVLTLKPNKPMSIESSGVVIVYGQIICEESFTKIKSGGQFIIKQGGSYYDAGEGDPELGDGGRFQINNGGVLTVESGGSVALNGAADFKSTSDEVTINGEVEMPSTSSSFSNTGTISGTGSVTTSGSYSNSGTVTLTTNGSLLTGLFGLGTTWSNGTVPGDTSVARINAGHVVSLGASHSVGSVFVDSAGTFNLVNDTITITDSLVIDADATFTTGTGAVVYAGDTVDCIASLTYHDLILAVTDTTTICGNLLINNNFTQQAGSFVDLSDAVNEVEVKGNVNLAGTLIHRNGTLKLTGTTTQSISVTDTVEIGNLTIDNANGVNVTSGVLKVTGTVTVNSGTLNTNDRLVIVSNATGTGAIGDLTNGSVSGNVVVQRYLPSAGNAWRMFGAPTTNFTFADLSDDVITTGIAGSDFPNYGFKSIYYYDETELGSSAYGYATPDSINQSLAPGLGYMAYVSVGSGLTIAHEGPINQGDFSFPVTFTDDPSQPDDEDGWNFLANPYPAALDWDAADWVKTNINDAVYIWNESAGQYATYIAGVGTNGGSRNIASGQGFWIQANGSSPVLTAKETCKSSSAGTFYKTNLTPEYIKLKATNANGSDEVVINIRPDGAATFNPSLDAKDLGGGGQKVPNLEINGTGGEVYAIKSLPAELVAGGVTVYMPNTGAATFQLALSGLSTLSGTSCTALTDLTTGQEYSIVSDTVLTFNTAAMGNSFIVTAKSYGGIALSSSETCYAGQPIDLNYNLTGTYSGIGLWNIQNEAGQVISQVASHGAKTGQIGLQQSGHYTAQFMSFDECQATPAAVELDIRPAIALDIEINEPACSATADGAILAKATGGWGKYQFSWAHGASTAAIDYLQQGIYHLTVSDQNGCKAIETVAIKSANNVEAEIGLLHDTVFVHENVQVYNFSNDASAFDWYYNGQHSDRIAPEIAFEQPGTYTIELQASNGSCSDMSYASVTVMEDVATDIVEPTETQPLHATQQSSLIQVQNNGTEMRHLRLYTLTGQLLQSVLLQPGELALLPKPSHQVVLLTDGHSWTEKMTIK